MGLMSRMARAGFCRMRSCLGLPRKCCRFNKVGFFSVEESAVFQYRSDSTSLFYQPISSWFSGSRLGPHVAHAASYNWDLGLGIFSQVGFFIRF
jgi:hypothetical protein